MDDEGGLTHLFPTSEALTQLDWSSIGLSQRQAATLTQLAAAISADLVTDVGADWIQAHRRLAAIPGLSPGRVEAIAMHARGDPDALPVDTHVLRGAGRLGLPSTAASLVAHASVWRPWRSYAAQHLVAAGRSTSAAVRPSASR